MKSSPIVIPRRYKIKEIHGETKEEMEIREEMALRNFSSEKNLLVVRAKKNGSIVNDIDNTMIDYIN